MNRASEIETAHYRHGLVSKMRAEASSALKSAQIAVADAEHVMEYLRRILRDREHAYELAVSDSKKVWDDTPEEIRREWTPF